MLRRSSFFRHSDLTKSIPVWTFQIKEYLGCGGSIKYTSSQRVNSGMIPHWLSLNLVMKSRYCRPIIIYSFILKPILQKLRQKFQNLVYITTKSINFPLSTPASPSTDWFELELDLLDLMIKLEASLETRPFCNLTLRTSMPLMLKFCYGQRDKCLPLAF